MKKIFTAFLAIVVICILLALGDVALNQQKTGGGKQTLTWTENTITNNGVTVNQ